MGDRLTRTLPRYLYCILGPILSHVLGKYLSWVFLGSALRALLFSVRHPSLQVPLLRLCVGGAPTKNYGQVVYGWGWKRARF